MEVISEEELRKWSLSRLERYNKSVKNAYYSVVRRGICDCGCDECRLDKKEISQRDQELKILKPYKLLVWKIICEKRKQ